MAIWTGSWNTSWTNRICGNLHSSLLHSLHSAWKTKKTFEYMKDKLESRQGNRRLVWQVLFSLHKWDSIPPTYCVHLMVFFIFNCLWNGLLEKSIIFNSEAKLLFLRKTNVSWVKKKFRAFCNIKKSPLEVWELFWNFKQNDNLTLTSDKKARGLLLGGRLTVSL